MYMYFIVAKEKSEPINAKNWHNPNYKQNQEPWSMTHSQEFQ